jgi:hypothetical protein
MAGEDPPSRLARPRPQLEDAEGARARGGGGLVLEALVVGHLGGHEREIGVGIPAKRHHGWER